ncbi:hypothetical protein LK994_01045 [Ferruginibacter lapsinanis]|uniref:hypothetical protein n=1 Tax=Ferruginibacter lapsinanis TaxID=563172 RepID=UPI001E5AF42B|nr:hypothetical protein [Ferruginibacter lapsinanis]UEG50060.1 hypothetical protein LK994_01045 [Ferruginibacter lapsinanis]
MPSRSETGHAKNVENFADLIAYVTSYGDTYNPSKEVLTVANLNILLANAKAEMSNVKTNETNFNNATNARMAEFKTLKPLSTQIINSLAATDATEQTVKNAKTINRKIQGQRTPKKETPPQTEETKNKEPKSASASQQSYDLLIDHFDKLIKLIEVEPQYNPNEINLQAPSLKKKITQLKATNKAVSDSTTAYTNSIITRNKVLYSEKSGLVDTAASVKKYVLSIYNASSPEYKQIKKIAFKSR